MIGLGMPCYKANVDVEVASYVLRPSMAAASMPPHLRVMLAQAF